MNLEAINKWLDEEYGCSYTRLEELHDFYFEKYCDLQQENKQLKDNWNKLKEYLHNADAVIDYSENYDGKFINYDELIDKMQELEQGSDTDE